MGQLLGIEEYSPNNETSWSKMVKGKIISDQPNRRRRSSKIKVTVKGRTSTKIKRKAISKVTSNILVSHFDLDVQITLVHSD